MSARTGTVVLPFSLLIHLVVPKVPPLPGSLPCLPKSRLGVSLMCEPNTHCNRLFICVTGKRCEITHSPLIPLYHLSLGDPFLAWDCSSIPTGSPSQGKIHSRHLANIYWMNELLWTPTWLCCQEDMLGHRGPSHPEEEPLEAEGWTEQSPASWSSGTTTSEPFAEFRAWPGCSSAVWPWACPPSVSPSVQ